MTIDLPRDEAMVLLRDMVRIRRLEERSAELYTEEKIRGFLHLYIGEEAVATGAMHALAPDDNVVATYREHGHALLRGIPAAEVMAEMFGKATGCSRGRGGAMRLFSAARRFYGGHAIVGGGLPVAAGLALADRALGRAAVTACFFGDGAVDEGEFHETLNLAALWKLPVLFLCENNLYAMGTAIERHQSDVVIAHKPPSYGIPAEQVDGMDVIAVLRAVRYAADAVRDGGGPRFLELDTYRFRAHSMYDPERYREKAEVERFRERDPIRLYRGRLLAQRICAEEEVEEIERAVEEEVAAAVAAAEAAPWEPVEALERDVLSRPVP